MKTLYSLILALVFVATLQSCGGKKEEQAAVEAPAGMITLDLSKYGKGIYLVKITEGDKASSSKVMVE